MISSESTLMALDASGLSKSAHELTHLFQEGTHIHETLSRLWSLHVRDGEMSERSLLVDVVLRTVAFDLAC